MPCPSSCRKWKRAARKSRPKGGVPCLDGTPAPEYNSVYPLSPGGHIPTSNGMHPSRAAISVSRTYYSGRNPRTVGFATHQCCRLARTAGTGSRRPPTSQHPSRRKRQRSTQRLRCHRQAGRRAPGSERAFLQSRREPRYAACWSSQRTVLTCLVHLHHSLWTLALA